MSNVTDREQYEKQHLDIFGHVPIADLTGQHLCIHPMHREIERIIDAPGVDIEIPFEVHSVLSDDDDVERRFNQAYEDYVQTIRDRILAMKEEDARLVRNQCSIGIHDVFTDPRTGHHSCRRVGCDWTTKPRRR